MDTLPFPTLPPKGNNGCPSKMGVAVVYKYPASMTKPVYKPVIYKGNTLVTKKDTLETPNLVNRSLAIVLGISS